MLEGLADEEKGETITTAEVPLKYFPYIVLYKAEDKKRCSCFNLQSEIETVSDSLRSYQKEGISNIFKCWKDGKRSVLFQMPTGTGKTVLFSEIVRMGFQKKRKILIVVHRIELVEQIIQKLHSKGVEAGRIVAGKTSDYSKIVQVASIQTLSRREHPEANLIIIDECHHAKAEIYKSLWEIYPDAKFLGVTATPVRLSGEGFDDIFDELIVSMSVQKFIEQGYLIPVSHYVCSTPDLSKVKKRQGDYATQMLSDVMMDNAVMSDLIEGYIEKCAGKSAIVFAVDVAHSKEIIARYTQAGIRAAHIDAKTPKQEREQMLADFRAGIIKVISNVEIITEGFDFPECEAIQLARPTKSLALYLQMVGRVMRTAKGKTEGIILDNAGLWLEHGLSIIDREWTLEATLKKSKKEMHFSNEVAMDIDGVIREINRKRPEEVKGLRLVPLTFEMKRLLNFESHLSNVKIRDQNLLAAYYKYMEELKVDEIQITKQEFEYIKKRLNFFNRTANPGKGYKEGFWHIQARELFSQSNT
ncbi:MAG TPA: DEAD/DEAH box helicase [Bacteroidia bacterium]|nr:DEAD/DEAH box helicase [Bacteroidia bacterium]